MRRIQRDFLGINGLALNEQFVSSHRHVPLWALAAYSLAGEYASNGDFNRAASLYADCHSLRVVHMDGAAALAEAVMLARNGNEDRAKQILARLSSDGKQQPTIRDGARYLAAVIAYGHGEWALSRLSLETMGQSTDLWQKKAALLSLALREHGQ
jgi:hypothetical protein